MRRRLKGLCCILAGLSCERAVSTLQTKVDPPAVKQEQPSTYGTSLQLRLGDWGMSITSGFDKKEK